MENTYEKNLAALLVAAMLFLLCACGTDGKAPNKPSELVNTEAPFTAPEKETNYLTDTKWINIYSGTVMSLNDDGSFTSGGAEGTWTQDGKIITLKYEDSDRKFEEYVDVLEENGIKFLRTQANGKVDGSPENFSVHTYYPEESIEAVRAESAKGIGETVSTDIVDVTVKKAALGYYANGVVSDSCDNVTNVSEACEPSNGGFFESSKGRCLLCIDFVIKNTDRSGYIDPSDYISFTVRQNGKSAVVKGYDLNEKDGWFLDGFRFIDLPISFDGGPFEIKVTPYVDAGHSMEVKYVGVVGFEPDGLDDPFEVIVTIMNSKRTKERYIYAINE